MKYSFIVFIFSLKSLLAFAHDSILSITPEGKFVYISFPNSSRMFVLDTVTNSLREVEDVKTCELQFVGIEHISVPSKTLEPPENIRALRKNQSTGVLICLEWTEPSLGAKPAGYLICCENFSTYIECSESLYYEEWRPYPFEACVYTLCSVDTSGRCSEAININIH